MLFMALGIPHIYKPTSTEAAHSELVDQGMENGSMGIQWDRSIATGSNWGKKTGVCHGNWYIYR